MALQAWPGFVGPSYVAQSLNASAEECINLYAERKDSGGGPPQYNYYGTPGRTLLVTTGDSPIRALFYQDGRAFSVSGVTLYEHDPILGTPTSLGNVLADSNPATISSNGRGGNQLFITSGGAGYTFNLTTNTFAKISVAGFPGGAAMGAFHSGYFLVLAQNNFQISGLENGSTWAGSDAATRSLGSDTLVAMIVNGVHLWLVGTRHTEVWYNSGAASFPFQPIPSVYVQYGTAAPFSVTRVDGAVGWLAQNEWGDRLVLLDSGSLSAPSRISTHAVETALTSYSTVSDFVGSAYQEQGHTFFVLTSLANAVSWVYDVATQLWHKRQVFNTSTGLYEADRQVFHANVGGVHWVGGSAGGNIYTQQLGTYTDAGTPLRSLRRVPHLNNGRRLDFYHSLQLDLEPGIGLVSGQGSDPQLMLRWSNDGGHVWSNEHWVTAGALGTYGTRAKWNHLGAGRNRIFELVQTDNVKRAWIGCYADIEAGL